MWEGQRQFPFDQFEADCAESIAEEFQREARALLLSGVVLCASCAEELGEFEAAAESLFILGSPLDPPAGFESRVMERIRSSIAEDRSDCWRHPPLGRADGYFCRTHHR